MLINTKPVSLQKSMFKKKIENSWPKVTMKKFELLFFTLKSFST